MKSTQQDFTPGRRTVRKRCGNIATGNIQAQSWDNLALFHNMSNTEYRILYSVKRVFDLYLRNTGNLFRKRD